MSAKKTTKSKAPEAKKAAKTPKASAKPKKLSALDAAAKVLGDAGSPMNCKELIEAMAKKGLWTSPGGQTPHATLYSAILRELKAKGKDARFKKTERGKFARTGAA
jgi:HB1, ASXL, restriction endonuclease HTH domain